MKKLWPLMIVGLLVLGGCGKTATTPTAKVEPTVVTSKTETMTAKTALKDLLTGGKEEKCTWTADDNGQSSDGILYVSGKKFKQEVTMTDAKTKVTNKLDSLSDGEWMYTWGSAMGNRGFKTSFSSLEEMATGAPTNPAAQGSGGVDLNKQYQYQCEPWTTGETDFTPPTDVTFVDMSSQLQQLKQLQQKFGGN